MPRNTRRHHAIRSLLGAVAVYVLLPFAAWSLANSIDQHAAILGPYLLASPIFAVMVSGSISSMLRKEPTFVEGPPEEQAMVNQWAARLGVGDVSLVVYEDEDARVWSWVDERDRRIWILDRAFTALDSGVCIALLAKSVGRIKADSKRRWVNHALQAGPVVLFGTLTALNPWLVIPAHLLTALGWWKLLSFAWQEGTFESDAAALLLTSSPRDVLELLKLSDGLSWPNERSRLKRLRSFAQARGLALE